MSGGSRTRLSDAAGRCLGCSATDTVSKGGRSRTLWARCGGRLLSQEHTPVKERKGQDSNLQGLFASPGFQPGAIVPVGSPFRILQPSA